MLCRASLGRAGNKNLRAPPRCAEACHHFVKNKQCPVAVINAPETFEQTGRGQDTTYVAGNRLDNHSRNIIAAFLERSFHASKSSNGTAMVVSANAFGTPACREYSASRCRSPP